MACAIFAELGLASTPPVERALAYDAFTLLRTGWDAQQQALS